MENLTKQNKLAEGQGQESQGESREQCGQFCPAFPTSVKSSGEQRGDLVSNHGVENFLKSITLLSQSSGKEGKGAQVPRN